MRPHPPGILMAMPVFKIAKKNANNTLGPGTQERGHADFLKFQKPSPSLLPRRLQTTQNHIHWTLGHAICISKTMPLSKKLKKHYPQRSQCKATRQGQSSRSFLVILAQGTKVAANEHAETPPWILCPRPMRLSFAMSS